MDDGLHPPVGGPEFLPDSFQTLRFRRQQVGHIIAHLHPDSVPVKGVIGQPHNAGVYPDGQRMVDDPHLVAHRQIHPLEQLHLIGLGGLPGIKGGGKGGDVFPIHQELSFRAAPVGADMDGIPVKFQLPAAGIGKPHKGRPPVQGAFVCESTFHHSDGFHNSDGEGCILQKLLQAFRRIPFKDKGDEIVLLVV